MVLKGVNWDTIQKSGNMVLKRSIGYAMIKLGKMVLKGVNWIHNDIIRSNDLERSQLGTHYKKIGPRDLCSLARIILLNL